MKDEGKKESKKRKQEAKMLWVKERRCECDWQSRSLLQEKELQRQMMEIVGHPQAARDKCIESKMNAWKKSEWCERVQERVFTSTLSSLYDWHF